MAPLVDELLHTIDQARKIAGEFGLRPYTVTVRVRTWSGSRVGLGTKTDTDTPLKVGGGTQSPYVREISQKEIVASGGLYQDQDIEVGPITPSYTIPLSGGHAISSFEPPRNPPTEVYFLVTGPGMASTGSWFKKQGQRLTSVFGYTIVLRRTGDVL